MPIYTVYAKIIRRGRRKHRVKNVAVHSLYDCPINYNDLKSELLTAARNIEWQYQQTLTEVTLEMHRAGRYKRAMTSYRQSRIRVGREPQMFARIRYIKGNDSAQVETASFYTPEFYMKYKDNYDEEKHRKWQMPKSVPTGFEATLQNPNMLFIELLTVKTPSYGQKPKSSYEAKQRRKKEIGMYAGIYRGIYAGHQFGSVEREEQEEETEHDGIRNAGY